MRRLATMVASVAMVSGLIACGDGEEAGAPSASARAAAIPTTAGGPRTDAVAAVPAALDFSAPLVDGTEFDARGLAGGTVVFWFWSPF